MKIERLSENQMRFTVWRQELEDNDIDISDIAGNKSGKADELLKMLMNRAKDEFGFEPESAPLVVEAMQVDQECMVFLVTKLEEGAEIDPKYEYIQKLKEGLKQNINLLSPSKEPTVEGIIERPVEKEKKDNILPYVIYTFTDIEKLITVAKKTENFYRSNNTLYITPDDVTYFLVASHNNNTDGEFRLLCRQLREFGKPYDFNYATKYYMDEHYRLVIRDSALQVLAELK